VIVCDSNMWCHTNSNPRFQKYKIQNERENRIGDEKLLVTKSNKDVGRYIDKCDLCQRIKNRIEAPIEKLMANEILKKL